MKPPGFNLGSLAVPAVALAIASFTPFAGAASIFDIVETGGDNEPTDTITAKWTGATYNITVANEPFPGAVIGEPYTVGTFASGSPAFVDRNHRYLNDPATVDVPGYLIGNEYIMSGNDNRDNATYQLAVTVTTPVRVYMLIDNRLSDGDGATPPTFGATSMQWIVDGGWNATANGLNRTADPSIPDELPFDEGADDTINQFYSIYYHDFPAGTVNLFQADNAGRNMYGAVVQTIPEPGAAAFVLFAFGVFGLRRRR